MSNEITCPKCGSTQITAEKKGFSAGKAVAGAVLTGGIGLLAGLHGSSDIEVTCLACGKQWNPKQLAEQKEQKERERLQSPEVMERRQKATDELRKWKADLYKAYKEKDYEKAEGIYSSKYQFWPSAPDIHAVYKKYKNEDRLNIVVILIICIVLLIILFWIIV